MNLKIPLHKPYWTKEAKKAVLEALKTGNGVGDGPYSQKLVAKLKTLTGSRYAFTTTSCTSAMEMAVACLGVKEGDEVICPSFTLSATAVAFTNQGAKPVFADIDPATYCLDPADVAKRLTKRTKGIMVVHYAGMAYQLEKLLKLAKAYKLWVVEDAAHAIGAYYKGKHLGTSGAAGCFSFHGTKNLACGEGGAVITNEEKLAEKMDIFRAIGTNRAAFLAGKVSLYEWVGNGSSLFLSDILASLITIQIDQITKINNKRTQIANFYHNTFQQFHNLLQLPLVPENVIPNWHIYALKFQREGWRKKFQRQMQKRGIEVSTHYVPLHLSPMGRKLVGKVSLPVTEEVARTLVRLPIYPDLTTEQLKYISNNSSEILTKFSCSR